MTARVETAGLLKTEREREALATEQQHKEGHRAPFSLRCGAFLIDYIIPASIIAFSTLVARVFGGGARMSGNTAETIGMLIALGVIAFNYLVLAGFRGTTMGKWATGLRIESRHGGPARFHASLLRHVIGYPLSLAPLGIGFLISAFNSQGRALHDFLAGTVVVLERVGRTRK